MSEALFLYNYYNKNHLNIDVFFSAKSQVISNHLSMGHSHKLFCTLVYVCITGPTSFKSVAPGS